MKIVFFLLTVLLACSQTVRAQHVISPGDRLEFLYRVYQLSDSTYQSPSFLIRPVSYPDHSINITRDNPIAWPLVRPLSAGTKLPMGLRFRPLDVEWFNSYNTTVPRGTNDGAIWQGVGYNTAFSGGLTISNSWLHVQLRPIIGMAQNRSFVYWPERFVSARNAYSFPFVRIDHVQRYGEDPYLWADLGDSFVEVRKFGVRVGFGTQRIWSGPAIFNPLQYSYNAPGLPKFYLKSNKPYDIKIGTLEFGYHFGTINESKYFDLDNDESRYLAQSLHFVYSPSFIKGFSLGLVRNYILDFPSSPRGYIGQIRKMVDPFYKSSFVTEDNPSGDDPDDQVFLIQTRWVFPEYQFELYAEYGRDDHATMWEEFFVHPDHSRTYVIGFLKGFDLSRSKLTVGFEQTVLDGTRNQFAKIAPGDNPDEYNLWLNGLFYWHYNHFGFINKGQLLGSGIGMGSNSRTFHLNRISTHRQTQITLTQIHYFNGLLHNLDSRNVITAANEPGTKLWETQPTEFMLGVRHTEVLPYGIEFTAAVEQSYVMNHYFIKKNDIWNTRMEVSIRKSIGRSER